MGKTGKLAKQKTGPTVALINDNRHIEITDYSLSFVSFNWVRNGLCAYILHVSLFLSVGLISWL